MIEPRGATRPDWAPSILSMVERERVPNDLTEDDWLHLRRLKEAHIVGVNLDLDRRPASRWNFARWRWRTGRMSEGES